MEDTDLIRIRDMLAKIVAYIDKNVINKVNGCLHEENVQNLTTMGANKRKYQCFDCGKIWEEEFEETMPPGLVQGQKINNLLTALTLHVADIDDFDDLEIPFRAVAADIRTGEKVVLASGSLATALS